MDYINTMNGINSTLTASSTTTNVCFSTDGIAGQYGMGGGLYPTRLPKGVSEFDETPRPVNVGIDEYQWLRKRVKEVCWTKGEN